MASGSSAATSAARPAGSWVAGSGAGASGSVMAEAYDGGRRRSGTRRPDHPPPATIATMTEPTTARHPAAPPDIDAYLARFDWHPEPELIGFRDASASR